MQRFRPAVLWWIVLSTVLGGVLGLLFGLIEAEQTYLDFLVYAFCLFGFFAGIPAAFAVLIMTFARVSPRLCTLAGTAAAFLGWSLALAWVDSPEYIIFAVPIAAVASLFFRRVARPLPDERPWADA